MPDEVPVPAWHLEIVRDRISSQATKPLAKVLMQGFLTTDGHEIYTDGFDRIYRLLQEVYCTIEHME